MEYIYINNYNYFIFIKDFLKKIFYKNKIKHKTILKKQNNTFLSFFKIYVGIIL
jgi:hypothetical protein